MTMPGATELVIILVIALIVFGGGKLAGVGKSLGQAISEFKSAVQRDEKSKSSSENNEKPVE